MEKEVKNETYPHLGKKFLLLRIISGIKEEKSISTIAKETNSSKQKLQYYIRQLKENGTIEKISYGVWKVKRSKNFQLRHVKEVKKINDKKTPKIKQVRGHAFTWRIRFRHNIDWERRLKRYKIKYSRVGITKTLRIIFDTKKIWLTKYGLVIYEPKSFFATNSIQSKGMAVYELDNTIKRLGRKLLIDLSNYQFTTSREHYGLIKNELARQYNKNGEKLYIKENGKIWMWIDDSHSLNELENNDMMLNKKIQHWYNDNKKHNFDVTSSFILNGFNQQGNSINKLTEHNLNQTKQMEEFAIALNQHIPAYERMGDITLSLLKEIKHLRKEINKINKNN